MPSQRPLLPCHPRKAAPRLQLLSVFPFPGPAPSHAHACPNLTCLSCLHICSRGRASVLSVPATPCCDLPPEQDTPLRWGFSGPGAQLAHLCLFIHAVLQPFCGQTQEVLGTGSWVSPAQPGSGWAQRGVRSRLPGPAAGLPSCRVCPPRRPVSLVVQWVDVTRLEKNATLLFPESIRVDTRDQELFFSMFLNIGETFKLMEQLANLAVRQLLDSEGFLEERAPPRPPRPHRNISALKRCVGPARRGPALLTRHRHPAWEGARWRVVAVVHGGQEPHRGIILKPAADAEGVPHVSLLQRRGGERSRSPESETGSWGPGRQSNSPPAPGPWR